MYAVPTPFAVITALFPSLFVTVATLEFVVDHFKLASFAYAPLFVFSLIVYFSPTPRVMFGLFLRLSVHF